MKMQLSSAGQKTQREAVSHDLWKRPDFLIGSIPGFAFVVQRHSDGRKSMVYQSKDAQEIFGIPSSQLSRDLTLLDPLIYPEDLTRLLAAFDASVGQEELLKIEYRFKHPKKSLIWLETFFRGVEATDGSVFWFCFAQDITDQKSIESALYQSEKRYREVFEFTSDGIYLIDVTEKSRFRFAGLNPVIERALELSSEQVIGKYLEEVLPQEMASHSASYYRQCLFLKSPISFEEEVELPAGKKSYQTTLIPVKEIDGRVCRIVAIARDVTEQRKIDKLRYERERDFRTLVENSPDVVVRYDRNFRRIYINRMPFPDVPLSAWLGKTIDESGGTDPVPVELRRQRLEAVFTTGKQQEYEFHWKDEKGQEHWYLTRIVPELDESGRVVSALSIARDITDRMRAEHQLRESELAFRTLVENSPDFIARYDSRGQRIYANPALRREMEKAGILGDISNLPVGAGLVDKELFLSNLKRVLSTGQALEFEMRLYEYAYPAPEGVRWLFTRMQPEFDATGAVQSALVIGRDITDIIRYREKVHQLAFFDTLTGIPNRIQFRERLNEVQSDSAARNLQFGVMVLDLDRFKEVNDTLGHTYGDLLLREVARRLSAGVRKWDVVARLSGDEFAILLPNIHSDECLESVARNVLEELSRPIPVDGHTVFLFASIGIARFPADSTDVSVLLGCADLAMHQAKNIGRNQITFHRPEMSRVVAERIQLGSALRSAVEKGELELWFQPIVDLRNGKTVGAEGLLRWNHPKQGLLTPDRFITIAEESGLIVDIGKWVFATACKTAVVWNEGRDEPLRVSVNLSSRQFVMNDLLGAIREILESTGCNPRWITLEITESLLLENNQLIRDMLNELSGMGFTIAIDDFGTGYSAMSYLANFPINILKIDRSFVHNVDSDENRLALVKAIISMAHALNMDIVAEGVESESQASTLNALGCAKAQGYLYGRPAAERNS